MDLIESGLQWAVSHLTPLLPDPPPRSHRAAPQRDRGVLLRWGLKATGGQPSDREVYIGRSSARGEVHTTAAADSDKANFVLATESLVLVEMCAH